LYDRDSLIHQTGREGNPSLSPFFLAVFLLSTLPAYWALAPFGCRRQNVFLIIASCAFCAWLDSRLVLLFLAGGLADYLVGRSLMTATRPGIRGILLGISLAHNLGMLAALKYMDFFRPLFVSWFHAVGLTPGPDFLNLVVPLGASFFTLQRLSYTLDIYRRRLSATEDLTAYLGFACFFPLLLSGPIERAAHLLPQFLKKRNFDRGKILDAMRQILWGLFKKVAIADSLAGRVDHVFLYYDQLQGIDLAAGAFLFAIQLYADFSAYSDIVIGVSRLFGFRVAKNFSYPYFSRDMAEFWRRWHISLSTWFRDYIFTPLTWNVNLNAHWLRMGCLLLTFSISGLWHGVTWTYIVWGAMNGLGFAPLVFGTPAAHQTRQAAEARLVPTVREGMQMLCVFAYVLLAWIFFRSPSIEHALGFIARMLTRTWFVRPEAGWLLLLAVLFLVFEWIRREQEHPLDIASWPAAAQWPILLLLSLSIYFFKRPGSLDFIYTHF
jgi:alginate O-acetyltransferase complex protein AlgI